MEVILGLMAGFGTVITLFMIGIRHSRWKMDQVEILRAACPMDRISTEEIRKKVKRVADLRLGLHASVIGVGLLMWRLFSPYPERFSIIFIPISLAIGYFFLAYFEKHFADEKSRDHEER